MKADPRRATAKSEPANSMGAMAAKDEVERSGSKFSQALEAAVRLPGVRINRAAYLRNALKRHCTDEQIEQAIVGSPAAAGIPFEIITEAANTSIKYETAKVTGISTVAGIPGGLAMIGTVPADLAQYMGHMVRIVQKLAYIYSWPDLLADEGEELDEATEGMLVLFIGVMFGAHLAQSGVTKAATMISAQVAKKLPQQALTKGAIYPIVKKVATYLGARMTTQIFASGVAKVVPVIGGLVSGGVTLGTFLPMAKRLQKHLASLELTKPDLRPQDDDIVTQEVVDDDPQESEHASSDLISEDKTH
ncbi:hypothetical protein [Microbacterium halotolerans]|uniref:hypothetical protein n=1 Tax=Microbacterium halotolerans TaxID=246613 RepID=UPI001968E394|nr:hypothetical protein [Microbacterium halotolerans]